MAVLTPINFTLNIILILVIVSCTGEDVQRAVDEHTSNHNNYVINMYEGELQTIKSRLDNSVCSLENFNCEIDVNVKSTEEINIYKSTYESLERLKSEFESPNSRRFGFSFGEIDYASIIKSVGFGNIGYDKNGDFSLEEGIKQLESIIKTMFKFIDKSRELKRDDAKEFLIEQMVDRLVNLRYQFKPDLAIELDLLERAPLFMRIHTDRLRRFDELKRLLRSREILENYVTNDKSISRIIELLDEQNQEVKSVTVRVSDFDASYSSRYLFSEIDNSNLVIVLPRSL